MAWRIGVDSGGTFTDICLFDEKSGGIAVWKVSSTAADPSLAIAAGLGEALAGFDVNASDVSYFGHGTTVATNALIQHRGARTGLITSDGFRDLLEIGRQKRPELYDLQADKPPVLVGSEPFCTQRPSMTTTGGRRADWGKITPIKSIACAKWCTTRSRAAPIDDEMCTSDVARQIRTQIHHHIRYFFRRRIAPRRRTCAVGIMDDPWIRGAPLRL